MGCKVTYVPLGELAEFESGGTPRKNEDSYWNGAIPWISAKTLKGDTVYKSDLYITEEGLAAGSKLAPQGSLLLLTRGSGLFKRIPIAMAGKDVAYNQDIKCIRATANGISNRYLFYALRSLEPAISTMLETTGIGAGKLATDRLKGLPVPILDGISRAKVTYFADCIYDKVALNAKLNGYLLELLKASAKNLYAEYERNEELELPVGWRRIEVDEISEMVCRGITPKYNPNSDETVLGQTCVRNNLVLLENGRLHSPKKVTEKWLQKYDLLINSTGVGSLGRTAQVWFEPTKLVVDSHITIVRCKDKKHALYLGFWAFEHEKYIESLHTGSTGQTELPRDHVKAIRLVLPSDEVLERFNKMSEPSVRLIAANQEESKRLADLRDALLPKLVSGEIDVSKVDLTQLNSHLA